MRIHYLAPLAIVAAVALATGCNQAPDAPAVADARSAADGDEHPGHSHGGWWCDEHGVPEEVCALCDSDLAAEFQRKGDWCKDHDRPDSQCFVCHPDLEARFAAQYEAKTGEKPPKPEG